MTSTDSGRSAGTRPDGTVPFRATLGRSVGLFAAFRKEQTDPEFFYGKLAHDTVDQLRSYTPLDGRLVVDVGGGPGYFADALRAEGARCLCVDSDAHEMTLHGRDADANAVQGSALDLPLRSGSVDVCFSSNVLEHVPDRIRMADEMVRVTRPGGLVYLSYTLWLSPWGGHETSPWHYLGGSYAAERFTRKNGRRPKNDFGRSMYAAYAKETLRWVRGRDDVDVVDIRPRYLPTWMKPIVHVPLLREIITWNLLIVLRKR